MYECINISVNCWFSKHSIYNTRSSLNTFHWRRAQNKPRAPTQPCVYDTHDAHWVSILTRPPTAPGSSFGLPWPLTTKTCETLRSMWCGGQARALAKSKYLRKDLSWSGLLPKLLAHACAAERWTPYAQRSSLPPSVVSAAGGMPAMSWHGMPLAGWSTPGDKVLPREWRRRRGHEQCRDTGVTPKRCIGWAIRCRLPTSSVFLVLKRQWRNMSSLSTPQHRTPSIQNGALFKKPVLKNNANDIPYWQWQAYI